MHPRKPAPATVIAVVALFLAAGGTALGAHHFLITSTHQIKPTVLRHLHGARGATGPAGPVGAQGPAGPTGPTGPPGPTILSPLTTVRAPVIKVHNKDEATSIATCPAGSRVVSGAQYTGFAIDNGSEMSEDHESWIVVVFNNAGIETNLEAIAYCAGAGQAVAASAGTRAAAHARALRQARALLVRVREEAARASS
jgi:hypothetical protein